MSRPYVDKSGDEYSIHRLNLEELELMGDGLYMVHSRYNENRKVLYQLCTNINEQIQHHTARFMPPLRWKWHDTKSPIHFTRPRRRIQRGHMSRVLRGWDVNQTCNLRKDS